MILIKLGGSVITNKAQACCFKQEIMDQLAAEIKKANKPGIIIHGAGSFGHILAKQYKLNTGYRQRKQVEGFALIHTMVQRLNTLVLTSLQNHGIPAVSLPPHAVLSLSNHRSTRLLLGGICFASQSRYSVAPYNGISHFYKSNAFRNKSNSTNAQSHLIVTNNCSIFTIICAPKNNKTGFLLF